MVKLALKLSEAMNSMNSLYHITKGAIKIILDVFFPFLCISCKTHIKPNADVNGQAPICEYCFKSIIIKGFIDNTGSPLKVLSIGNYSDETLRNLIHAFKYEKRKSADKIFARLIDKYLMAVNLANSIDLKNTIIVPVPLYPKKERQRGFNQAEVIAKHLSNQLKTPLRTDIIKRVRNTAPQISLRDNKEREENLKDSFALNKNAPQLADKNIIIVDDVYTSGATIKEAARVLKKLKPKSITAFVIAKA